MSPVAASLNLSPFAFPRCAARLRQCQFLPPRVNMDFRDKITGSTPSPGSNSEISNGDQSGANASLS